MGVNKFEVGPSIPHAGDSRYLGGTEEPYAECIAAFWCRFGRIEESEITCEEG